MKDRIQNGLQNFSRAIIKPVFFMAVTGFLIAMGVVFKLDFMPGFIQTVGNFVFELMMQAGIYSLPVVFTVGIATSLANRNKDDAAILSILVYLLFIFSNNFYMQEMGMLSNEEMLFGTGQAVVFGVQIVDMGVFIGIILGTITGYVFNKFSSTKFPDALSIYGGSRFAYLIMIFVTIGISISSAHIWPYINDGINAIASTIDKTGSFGVFVYGFLNRFLIPTGLHHLIWMPFTLTSLGGMADIGGEVVQGATPILNAQLGYLAEIGSLNESIKYLFFGFSKVFGALGITLAMIKTAKPENKSKVKGMLIPAALVAVLSGITEPLEFMFLFISPLLWFVHSLLDGLGQMLVYLLGGQLPFSNGLIDTTAQLAAIPWNISKPWIVFGIGAIFIVLWYVVFKYLIEKLDIETPGREKLSLKSNGIPEKNEINSENSTNVQPIIDGLGGAENIQKLNNCFTRLRVTVENPSLVNKDLINEYKNSGIVEAGKNIQIVIGIQVSHLREEIAEVLNIE